MTLPGTDIGSDYDMVLMTFILALKSNSKKNWTVQAIPMRR